MSNAEGFFSIGLCPYTDILPQVTEKHDEKIKNLEFSDKYLT
jgi:hypothetical protein